MEIIATNVCAVMHVYIAMPLVLSLYPNRKQMLMWTLYGHSNFSYTLDSIVKGCVPCARSEFLFLVTSNDRLVSMDF